jgi:hypothetical protein
MLMVLVGDALVRYVNSGVTLGAVNLPEVNLRSLMSDEQNHARVRRIRSSEVVSILTAIGDLHTSQRTWCFEKR